MKPDNLLPEEQQQKMAKLEKLEAQIRQHSAASKRALMTIKQTGLFRLRNCESFTQYVEQFDSQLGLKRLYQLLKHDERRAQFFEVTGVHLKKEGVSRSLFAYLAKVPNAKKERQIMKSLAKKYGVAMTSGDVDRWFSEHADELGLVGVGDEYPTPEWLFKPVDEHFQFEVDVAANKSNSLCKKFFAIKDDGLKQDWTQFKSCWCNPPFSKGQTELWVKKAYETALKGTNVVVLTMNTTEVDWFHSYSPFADILFIKDRVTFGGADGVNRFGTMLLLFHLQRMPKLNMLSSLGDGREGFFVPARMPLICASLPMLGMDRYRRAWWQKWGWLGYEVKLTPAGLMEVDGAEPVAVSSFGSHQIVRRN